MQTLTIPMSSRTIEPDHLATTGVLSASAGKSPGGKVSIHALFDNAVRHLRRALLEQAHGERDAALTVAFVRWQIGDICRATIHERRGRDTGQWDVAAIRIDAAFDPIEELVRAGVADAEQRLDAFFEIQRDLCWLRDTLPNG